MSWFKVDDKLHDHRKTRAARRGGDRPRDAAAMGLWVLAGSWAAGNETDGFVPEDELDSWDTDGVALAGRLVAAGYWEPAEQDGEQGFRFCGWDEYQPTKAQLEKRRESARERMRTVRANGGKTSRAVRSTPTRPDPSPNNTPTADAASATPDGFDAFWQQYPRKVGKGAAVKAYDKALKRATAAQVAAGLENARQVWTATGTEPRFIPHPATWLNRDSWADEVPLPDAPPATRVSVVANQCPSGEPHGRHDWTDNRNTYRCMGA